MKRLLKIVGIVIALLVVAAIGLGLALPFIIDANQYKGYIVKTVKDKTGRDLTLKGPIGLSVFPWLGVELNDVTFGNAPGFGPAPMASVKKAGVAVKLWPLLHKELVVKKILLDGLTLDLAKNAHGETNWADLVGKKSEAAPATPTAPSHAPMVEVLSIGAVDVSHADITWRDLASGKVTRLRNVRLRVGEMAPRVPAAVHLGLDLQSGTRAPVRATFDSRATFDPAQQSLRLSNIKLQVGDLRADGSVDGTHLFGTPAFAGALRVEPFDLRALLTQWGALPAGLPAGALKKVAATVAFDASSRAVRLSKLALTVDDSTLTGNAAIDNLNKPSYRFDLAVDRLDADRYLPPKTTAKTKPRGGKPGGTPATPAEQAAVVIPLHLLRTLDVAGRLRIGTLKAFGVRSSAVDAPVNAGGGVLRFGPATAKLYGGGYRGDVRLDARGPVPALTLNETLERVALGPFLKDAGLFDKFEGQGNVQAALNARGRDAKEIRASLNGSGSADVANGVLRGVDLRKMTDEIEQAVKTKQYGTLASLAPQKTDQTPFTALKASVQVRNGIVSNNDLAVRAAPLAAGGRGIANLVNETLDYTLLVNTFPIKVSGPFSAPKFAPDWNLILRNQGQKALDKEREKLQQRLDNKLQDLFKKR